MKSLIVISACAAMVACATPMQKEQNQYIRTIQKAQRAIEFGQSEITTGKETILRGEKRIKENKAIILNAQKGLNSLGYGDTVITETVTEK